MTTQRQLFDAPSPTTLQLAEKIAYAVMASVYDHGTGFMWEGAKDHAPAVLRVLYEHDAWFCRFRHDGDQTEDLL